MSAWVEPDAAAVVRYLDTTMTFHSVINPPPPPVPVTIRVRRVAPGIFTKGATA